MFVRGPGDLDLDLGGTLAASGQPPPPPPLTADNIRAESDSGRPRLGRRRVGDAGVERVRTLQTEGSTIATDSRVAAFALDAFGVLCGSALEESHSVLDFPGSRRALKSTNTIPRRSFCRATELFTTHCSTSDTTRFGLNAARFLRVSERRFLLVAARFAAFFASFFSLAARASSRRRCASVRTRGGTGGSAAARRAISFALALSSLSRIVFGPACAPDSDSSRGDRRVAESPDFDPPAPSRRLFTRHGMLVTCMENLSACSSDRRCRCLTGLMR